VLAVETVWDGLAQTRHMGPLGAEPTAAALWRRAPGSLWRSLLDDVVAVDANGDGEPFAVSGGATLWHLLDEPRRLDDLAERLGDPAAMEDLATLLAALSDAGVVERLDW
jgi:hypothetical protein